jgi:NDP-sugar pyrophosphorylase family protein
MNIIHTHPVEDLGYHFIEAKYLAKGKDEYHLRYRQNGRKTHYRPLTAAEIETLTLNRNTSDNWQQIQVDKAFNANLVKNCKFYGLVRIGKLQALYREFHNLRLPVGLYNSTIISSDIGDNVCIDNVNYLSHYIIGNDVMIANVNELAATDKAHFGNGNLKNGETEKQRIRIEVCNENGGRSIVPFDGMLAGDAYLWSKYRDDDALLAKFTEFAEQRSDSERGYYGVIGERTIIKNCRIIKDTKIGSDAYIKGANKLKNITINSDADRPSQIGEGCELVNGIVGYGSRIFYGVKAVRFITASHSQLKYGARLINSYLGNNSTISCCEVLNSLIFPAHEQHHNNSFLCASLIMGQSNIAAGATIGSNHNSRSADGEIIADRGFWPGLCVSLKHNSKFAAFTIVAKGDFSFELNIPIPFSLVSNDVSNNRLVIMPGYWFMYNMYALARNAWKYQDRDQRTQKIQTIEYDYLAPDTVNALFDALGYFQQLTVTDKGEATVTGWENSNRPVVLTKIPQAAQVFTNMIRYYGVMNLLQHIQETKPADFAAFKKSMPSRIARSRWQNIGGQLIREDRVHWLKQQIKSGKIKGWDAVHGFYQKEGQSYNTEKRIHAYTCLLELLQITGKQFNESIFRQLLHEAVATSEWMMKGIYQSREKDYSSTFRKMVYDTPEEMNRVIGRIEDNSFIQQQAAELDALKKTVKALMRKWKL